jgi:HlyD family secretion protein
MAETQESQPRRVIRIILALTILSAGGFLVWWYVLRRPADPNNVIFVSGRIEGDDSAVAPKVAGRIREITVREGDQVKAGQVIAVLDDDQLKAREEQARSAVEQAAARVARAQQQIAVLQAQLQQSQLSVDQSRVDAQGRVSQAEAQVAAAEAQLAQAEASYNQALYDAEKYAKLAGTGDVSERTDRQARTTAESQRALVASARKQVEAARGALLAAKANLANPSIRAAQSAAIEKQIAQAQADVEAARADAARARAQLEEARANRSDLTVVAPFDGTIATRAAEPGEVVTAGTPIVTLINLNQVYLRGFIPEGQIGRVRVGQRARVYLDSDPQAPIDAVVSRIDPEASFTPENTYFRHERVKQVVGVKLQLNGAYGYAKPGMPADGHILVEGDQWPAITRR